MAVPKIMDANVRQIGYLGAAGQFFVEGCTGHVKWVPALSRAPTTVPAPVQAPVLAAVPAPAQEPVRRRVPMTAGEVVLAVAQVHALERA